LIKYLGSKRTLIPKLLRVVEQLERTESIIDLFSGTSRVGHAMKGAGYRVLSNDHNAYAALLSRCYVQSDREDLAEEATEILKELQATPGKPGYFTETFCIKSRFFKPKNGEKIDAIREVIAKRDFEPELEAVLLVSLMEAADRVDSTTGLQMAYLKKWAARASKDLELRLPNILPRATHGKSSSHQLDALTAAKTLHADVAYLDPPYNQHKYVANYHIWETLTLWDKPEVYGVACKRVDVRERRSPYNSKPRAVAALKEVVDALVAPRLIVSFSDEGYIGREDMENMLQSKGHVAVLENDFKRYVGAQIGIHNPKGKKVGEVSHLRNTEYIYVVSPDIRDVERVMSAF